jgi:4-oxalocrotonate tautomerase
MASVNVRVVTGVLDDSEKQPLIGGITELVVDVEGKGNRDFSQYRWVIVDEIESGMLGVAGQSLTTVDVLKARG